MMGMGGTLAVSNAKLYFSRAAPCRSDLIAARIEPRTHARAPGHDWPMIGVREDPRREYPGGGGGGGETVPCILRW